jgi:hypothetical protein
VASFPSSNAYTENGIDRGTFRQRMTDHLASTVQLVGAGTLQALTIASGAITPASGASGSIVIDTEAAASSDTLTNISTANLPDGSHILIRIADNGRVVDITDQAGGAGQIALEGGLDHQLNLVGQWIELRREGTDWQEVRRGGRETEHIVGDPGEPAFANSYTAVSGNAPRFWKDSSGIVHLAGRLGNTDISAFAETAFTLPAGYRPGGTGGAPFVQQASVSVAGEFFFVVVDTDGTVDVTRPDGASGSAITVSLYGIYFRADA